MYIDINTGQEVTESEIRRKAKPVGLKASEFWDNSTLAPYGVVKFFQSDKPELLLFQTVEEGIDKSQEDGWHQQWNVVDLPISEIQQILKNAIDNKRDRFLSSQEAVVTLDDGRVFQTKPSAYAALQGALISALAGALPEDTVWRDIDNVGHPATPELLTAIAAKEAERQNNIWANAWLEKATVNTLVGNNDIEGLRQLAQ